MTAPTVVLVTIDTLRADRVGCYGHADAGTPHMDDLAARGARFTSAQTTAPLTLPAHTSLLTGRTLPAHGVWNNGTFALPESVPTLAEALHSAGYATAAFVSSPVLARRYGLARGFERYDDAIAHPAAKEALQVHYDERSGVETATRAIAWLEDQRDRPVFLWVHFWEPHAPYHPPAPFAERFAADRYQGEVAAADAALGRLMEGVRALGRGERWLVIVTADHGEGLGDHGEPTHGLLLYRETMQVPLIVNGASFGVRTAVLDAPVGHADLAPTILALAGRPPLAGADGVSLAPGLTGAGPWPQRAGVFAESHLPQLEYGWSGLRALVAADGWKLIDAPRAELYDRRTDSLEVHDVVAAHAAEVTQMRAALEDTVRRAAASAPSESAARSASSEELEQLRSLGYTASGGSSRRVELVDRRGINPADRREFVTRFDHALELSQQGQHAQAVALYRELVLIDPKNPALAVQACQSLILAGRLDEALVEARRATTLDAHSALAWQRVGQLLDNRKDVRGAEAAYRRAIAADPQLMEPRKALASLLIDAHREREALDELERAQKLDPNDAAIKRDLERLWRKR